MPPCSFAKACPNGQSDRASATDETTETTHLAIPWFLATTVPPFLDILWPQITPAYYT